MFTDHGERQWPGREVHMAIGKEAKKGMQLTSSFFFCQQLEGYHLSSGCVFLPQLTPRTAFMDMLLICLTKLQGYFESNQVDSEDGPSE